MLSAGAIFMASWLQDRSVRKREEAAVKQARLGATFLLGIARRHLSQIAGRALTQERAAENLSSGSTAAVLQTDLRTLRQYPIYKMRDANAMTLYVDAQVILSVALTVVERSRKRLRGDKLVPDSAIVEETMAELKRVDKILHELLISFCNRVKLPVPKHARSPEDEASERDQVLADSDWKETDFAQAAKLDPRFDRPA